MHWLPLPIAFKTVLRKVERKKNAETSRMWE